MSDITITVQQSGPKYLAETTDSNYESDNGVDWRRRVSHHVPLSLTFQDELRQALIRHLDTTTEPQRANVVEREIVIPSEGDYVQWAEHNGPNARSFGWLSNPLKVTGVDNEEKCFYHGNDLPTAWYFSNYGYTIVPAPTPEREVFTGDPSTWGKGWYREVLNSGYMSGILVSEDGGYVWIGKSGSTNSSNSGWTTTFKYRRISDNPSKAVKWEGGEG